MMTDVMAILSWSRAGLAGDAGTLVLATAADGGASKSDALSSLSPLSSEKMR